MKTFAAFGNIDIVDRANISFEKDCANPDFVVVKGGDGTILKSERAYPCIPKITVRESRHGNKCMYNRYELEGVINHIRDEKYTIVEEPKLLATCDGVTFNALNEIQIHNANPMHAIRFDFRKGDEYWFDDEVIADGIVLSTPFGYTGYFSSVVQGDRGRLPVFEDEIGVAINNAHNVRVHQYHTFKTPEPMVITMLRGDGFLIADNNPFMKPVTTGDRIVVVKDTNTAKFVKT